MIRNKQLLANSGRLSATLQPTATVKGRFILKFRIQEWVWGTDLDLSFARRKYMPGPAGEKVFDIVNDRRPEFYGDIVRPDAYKPAG